MTYVVAGEDLSHTVDWNCEAGEKMMLTFTGSGAAVTYSPSCISSDATDDWERISGQIGGLPAVLALTLLQAGTTVSCQ